MHKKKAALSVILSGNKLSGIPTLSLTHQNKFQSNWNANKKIIKVEEMRFFFKYAHHDGLLKHDAKSRNYQMI